MFRGRELGDRPSVDVSHGLGHAWHMSAVLDAGKEKLVTSFNNYNKIIIQTP